MTVEEHSSLHFTRAFLDCGNAVTGFFGEALVNEFLVKAELNKQNRKSQRGDYRAENRKEEKRHHTNQNESNREVNPAEKRVWIFLERFYVATLATAVVFEEVRHILARHLFAFATGIALGHIVANMRDFVAHKFCALRLVVNKTL